MTMRVQSSLAMPPAKLPMLVAKSPSMLTLLAQVQQLASGDCPVLIEGETGTGKELIARALHNGRGPFVVIDCTHLTPQLVESELFGCVRGAYTGADTERIGLIERAHGGVAFFDEVGELPLDMQAKLLRLLQQKTFRRVGSSHEQHSDFRVIAATNRNLKRESQEKQFRQDLYFRLNVGKVRVPALRERREDIPVLVEHFLQPKGWTMPPEIMERFLQYDWPGNVRQLENTLQRMLVQSIGDHFTLSDLPATICKGQTESIPTLVRMSQALQSTGCSVPSAGEQRAAPCQPEAAETMHPFTGFPLLPLEEMEYWMILRALQETQGDRSQAADLLKTSRTTLYRRLALMEQHSQFRLRLKQLTCV